MRGFRVCCVVAAITLIGCSLFCTPATTKGEIVLISLADPQLAGLRGYVFADLNRNRKMDIGEGLISDVVIHCTPTATLSGGPVAADAASYTAYTDKYGHYVFEGLSPGIYSLKEETPIQFLPGLDGCDPGTLGGESNGPDEFIRIPVRAGTVGVNYNFGEYGIRSKYMSKRHLLTYGGDTEVYEGGGDIPEPAGVVLLATGSLLGLAVAGRRRARR